MALYKLEHLPNLRCKLLDVTSWSFSIMKLNLSKHFYPFFVLIANNRVILCCRYYSENSLTGIT